LTLVAHTGQVVPGFDEPHILSDFRSYDLGAGYGPDPVFTDSGRLVFFGHIEGPLPDRINSYNRYYISDAVGELRDILPPGTQLDVSSVPGSPDIRTVDGKSFRLAGSANDADQVAVLAYFTDGSSAVVLVSYADACLADVNGDGAVSPADFSAWVAAYNAQAPGCDQNGDEQCTAADFSAWVTNYNSGC
ncbi:MAG: GC-type dockerin domain-anchored protein, partial [Phycisphaerales bacterium JB058]